MRPTRFLVPLVLGLLLAAVVPAAEPVQTPIEPSISVEPDGTWTGWLLGGKEYQEIRAGYALGDFEVALGVAHTGQVRDDNPEDPIGLRIYGLVHALDAEMVARWFGGDVELPDGSLYAGLFGGYRFDDGDWESGPVVGTGSVSYTHLRAHET